MKLENYLSQATDFARARVQEAIKLIEVEGSIEPGATLASTSTECPNYNFTWLRDQALTFRILLEEYESCDETTPAEAVNALEALFKAYVNFTQQVHAKTPDADRALAKYFMDAQPFQDKWCNPQTDGPALRAIMLMGFATKYIDLHPNDGKQWVLDNLYDSSTAPQVVSPIKRDLEYLSRLYYNDNNPNDEPIGNPIGCDIWEEVEGFHFYSRLQHRKAFLMSGNFTKMIGDPLAGEFYNSFPDRITTLLDSHFRDGAIAASARGSADSPDLFKFGDVQTVLATIHARPTAHYAVHDDRVLSNVAKVMEGFDGYFKLGFLSAENPELGLPVGRYPKDKYNGRIDSGCSYEPAICPPPCGGQPWFLATNAIAEHIFLFVDHVLKHSKQITINQTNRLFFEYFGAAQHLPASGSAVQYDSETTAFKNIVQSLLNAADAQLRRVAHHAPTYTMSEQFNADTGALMSAENLTWSYASLLSAVRARNQVDPKRVIQSFTPRDQGLVTMEVVANGIPDEYATVRVIADTKGLQDLGDPCTGGHQLYRRKQTEPEGVKLNQYSGFVNVEQWAKFQLQVVMHVGDACDPNTMVGGPKLNVTALQSNPVESLYLRWQGAEDIMNTTIVEVATNTPTSKPTMSTTPEPTVKDTNPSETETTLAPTANEFEAVDTFETLYILLGILGIFSLLVLMLMCYKARRRKKKDEYNDALIEEYYHAESRSTHVATNPEHSGDLEATKSKGTYSAADNTMRNSSKQSSIVDTESEGGRFNSGQYKVGYNYKDEVFELLPEDGENVTGFV